MEYFDDLDSSESLEEQLREDQAAYICNSCGEEIVVPIDLSAGSSQEYVEDCPVCCNPNVIEIQLFDGHISIVSRAEQDRF